MLENNIILATDSYKVTHWKQYPKGTQRVFSFLESRGGEFKTTTFFGLSYIIKRFLAGKVVTHEKIAEAREFFKLHFGDDTLFNLDDWNYILAMHGGQLPVSIRAIPEGTTVPTGNVLMTIENTDPNVPWLTNYLETILMQVWYPTTVCTQSRAMKQDISEAMRLSGADMAGLPFKLHDFGYRGSTSFESAGIGGCAHLVNFMGTDTMAALQVARNYYNEPMAGFSIPAAEHSTMTAWGKTNEAEAYRNMLEQFPKGLVAVVSDSYDIYHACSEIWGDELKDQVLNRDGVVIIRPDSGDPVKVILSLLSILGDKFGVSTTSTGDRVLNPKVRLIQGDGIDREMLTHILDAMLDEKWSIDNIAFGSGGGLLQKVNRDTCKFALKCSAIEVNGKWLDVMKDPITDSGKRSKAGRLILVKDKGGYRTVQEGSSGSNLLEEVFRNGQHILPPTLSGIRERASR